MTHKRLLTPLCTIFSLLLLWFILPSGVSAHIINAPAELITQLLKGHATGPFILSASQYATVDLTELEVQVSAFGGRLPEDVVVEAVAVSAETSQQYSATLIQHHSTFSTTLPLNGEDWQVTIQVKSQFGKGSAEVNVVPYRLSAETSPLIRSATFASPFILMLLILIVFNRSGLSLQTR
ncbi:MAG: hypothetical protein ACPG8W_08955 [Candidatus Promineifilaceae bacterium]